MEKSMKIPDSDRTARTSIDERDEIQEETDETGRQISNKSGKHSRAEKLAASRPDFGPKPGGGPVPGATGNPEEPAEEHTPSGSHRDKALKP